MEEIESGKTAARREERERMRSPFLSLLFHALLFCIDLWSHCKDPNEESNLTEVVFIKFVKLELLHCNIAQNFVRTVENGYCDYHRIRAK